MQDFTYYFWTFILGAFLGVVIETLWCFVRNRKVESRKGVIFGPFNPLYGCATVCITMTINLSSNKSFGKIFLIGIVVASIVEYACSYYQEKIVGTVSWDYKNFKYNLNGRINLVYSIIWGFLTVLWYEAFMPIIDDIMPIFMGVPKITIVCFVLMILDCLVSLGACIRRRQRRAQIAAKTKLEKHFDYVYDDELLDKIYPNAHFVEEKK